MRQFRMISVFSLAAVSAFLLCSPGAFADAPAAAAKPAAKGPSAEEIGKKVQAFYDSLKTFKANHAW